MQRIRWAASGHFWYTDGQSAARGLPNATYRRLLPHLEATKLTIGQSLFPRLGPLPFAYFPTESIVTLSYAIEEGAIAKAWPVGAKGYLGSQ
jgi:hypothetical protein